MLYSSLIAFLDGVIAPNVFEMEITEEVAACVEGVSKKGGIGELHLTSGPETTLTISNLVYLLEVLENGNLSLDAGNYIANCVMLDDNFNFETDLVADTVYILSDDTAPLTQSEVRKALAIINTS